MEEVKDYSAVATPKNVQLARRHTAHVATLRVRVKIKPPSDFESSIATRRSFIDDNHHLFPSGLFFCGIWFCNRVLTKPQKLVKMASS